MSTLQNSGTAGERSNTHQEHTRHQKALAVDNNEALICSGDRVGKGPPRWSYFGGVPTEFNAPTNRTIFSTRPRTRHNYFIIYIYKIWFVVNIALVAPTWKEIRWTLTSVVQSKQVLDRTTGQKPASRLSASRTLNAGSSIGHIKPGVLPN